MNFIAHAPHAHAPVSVSRVMATVMLALAPATLFGFWLYGWPAIFLWLVTVLTAIITEALMLRMQKKPVGSTLFDGSAALTGWLLALSLPPYAPWWIASLGAAFAIVVAKSVFGGLGQNVFNPAMAARVMLLIAFPLEMTLWAAPLTGEQSVGFMQGLGITFSGAAWDSLSSASVLGHVKTEFTRGIDLLQSLPVHYNDEAAAFGTRAGSLGETAGLLLIVGGIVLIARRIITWHAPLAMLLGVAVPALIAHAFDPARFLGVLPHLLSGGVILGAFFIVTDPVTNPNTAWGQFVFGLGVGLLTWLIRTFGGYPEGVAFAVLLMNAVSPLIDRYMKPRIYGRDRQGRSLPVQSKES